MYVPLPSIQRSTSARCQIAELPSCTGAGKLGWLITSFRIFCRLTPITSATSVRPTRSGVASINLASGTARRTSARALSTASLAVAASRTNSRPRRPGWPMPTNASSQPSSANFSISASVSVLLVGSWYLRVKVNSISITPSLRGSPDYFLQGIPLGLLNLRDLRDLLTSWAYWFSAYWAAVTGLSGFVPAQPQAFVAAGRSYQRHGKAGKHGSSGYGECTTPM